MRGGTMDLCIYTLTHKEFDVPPDPTYVPLHVGRACAKDLGFMGDDTGENISELNRYYSELTGHYWIWKNDRSSRYVGTCHYRRYLLNEQEKIFTKEELLELLGHYDLITTKKVLLNDSYQNAFSVNHNGHALIVTGEVIKELYPDDYEVFMRLVNENRTYFGNMLVTSKELFDAYVSWLFSIFFEVQKRIDLETGGDDYHKRVFGFISEFLLLVWVTARKLCVCECKVGMLGEKAETAEMKKRLAMYFYQGDVDGAKAYFLKQREKRPDVLMEASDITGELRLCMQIIATAGKERDCDGKHILQRVPEYQKLIALFSELNRVASAYLHGVQTKEDEDFLRIHPVSGTAIEIAVRILGADAQASRRVMGEMRMAAGL